MHWISIPNIISYERAFPDEHVKSFYRLVINHIISKAGQMG